MNETIELLRVAATGGAAGAGAVIAYVTSRTFVESLKGWFDDRKHARQSRNDHDRDLVPILRDDAAAQRAELWTEIRSLRDDLRSLREELDESVRRETECERRHAESSKQFADASARFTAEIETLRRTVETLSSSVTA